MEKWKKNTPPKSNHKLTNHCATTMFLSCEMDLSDEAVFFGFLIKTLVVFIQLAVTEVRAKLLT